MAQNSSTVDQAERAVLLAQTELVQVKDDEKRDGDLKKAVEAYKAAQPDLEANQTRLVDHYDKEVARLALSDAEKKQVDDAYRAVNDPLEALRDDVSKRKTELKASKDTLDTETTARDKAKQTFEDFTTQIKLVEDHHREADAKRKEAVDARAKGQRLLAYYLLVHKMKPKVNEDPKPIEIGAYKDEIAKAANACASKNRKVANLEIKLKDDAKALADLEKAFADLEKSFDADLRARLTTTP